MPEGGQDFQNRGAADILMLLIFLGCKLSSQSLSDACSRVSQLCHILSEGYKYQR
jgi:GTP cyclohydrolase I